MRYKGSRLHDDVKGDRGLYTRLSLAVCGKKKGLDAFYGDDLDIHIRKLTDILRATGKPITYFVDFEEGELPYGSYIGTGNGNIVNSVVNGDISIRLQHLEEVIALKDETIADKESIIALKDNEVALWKQRYEDLARHAVFGGSDKNGTQNEKE